jgi:O-antigen/teichoic acid export membrane protein
MIDIVGVAVYYLSAIPAALSGFGIWSFIVAAIIKEGIETFFSFIISPYVPSLNFKFSEIKKLIKFGIFIQGGSLATFFTASITPVIGGRILGPNAVGFVDFAENLASLPVTIAMNFARVAFSGYSRIQHQRVLLFKSINKSIAMLSIILYIFPAIIFAFGPELIKTIYTEKWLPALPALYVFAIGAFFHPVNSAIGQGILAIGLSKEIFKVTLISALIGWVSAFILVQEIGFTGIAISLVLVSILICLFCINILGKNGYSLPLTSIILPKFSVFLVTLIICLAINSVFPQGLIFLSAKLAIAGIIYMFFSYMFGKEDINELLTILRNQFRKHG